MLGDKLNNLLTECQNGNPCKFSSVYNSIDADSQVTLLSVMRNTNIPVSRIATALNDEGHDIGMTTLREARHCITGSKKNCRCGFSSKGE